MSCCGGNCGCGSGCKCGTGCGGCKMYPDFGETSRTEGLIVGLGPERTNYFEGSEMSVGAENDGCNCGADCKCGSDCQCGK